MKKGLMFCITIMLMLSSACNTSNNSVENVTVSKGAETSQTNTTSEHEYCDGVWTNLDSETEKLFYGTWKVEKLLGFANSYNDASEYPTGQKMIGDEFIIKKDFFSSKGLKNYKDYQHELKNPIYKLEFICYNSDSFYRLFKTDPDPLNININDKVKYIVINDSSTKLGIPLSFFIVNNDRVILLLEATSFELKKA